MSPRTIIAIAKLQYTTGAHEKKELMTRANMVLGTITVCTGFDDGKLTFGEPASITLQSGMRATLYFSRMPWQPVALKAPCFQPFGAFLLALGRVLERGDQDGTRVGITNYKRMATRIKGQLTPIAHSSLRISSNCPGKGKRTSFVLGEEACRQGENFLTERMTWKCLHLSLEAKHAMEPGADDREYEAACKVIGYPVH